VLRHVIVSGSYLTHGEGKAIPSGDFTAAFASVVSDGAGAEPVACVSYTSGYRMDPVASSLKDAWIGLSNMDRVAIHAKYPALSQAIFLMLVGAIPDPDPSHDTTPPEKCDL